MAPDTYLNLKKRVIDAGYANEVDWAEGVQHPEHDWKLAQETIFVICNSGMKYQIAIKIYDKICDAIKSDVPVIDVFKNKNKARAIQAAWDERSERFDIFKSFDTDDARIVYFSTLDGIGPVTKYHLAKNCGVNVCKPDRHLVRIAYKYGMSAETMCSGLSSTLGERIGVVDVVIWRAANLGWI